MSHFKPAMTTLGAGLTPVVIRLPAVYPPTPLRSKISLCSVSFCEERNNLQGAGRSRFQGSKAVVFFY